MRVYVTSVFVDDQDKALQFYTEKLGFTQERYPAWPLSLADGRVEEAPAEPSFSSSRVRTLLLGLTSLRS
jgi:catechol 2,3-dioxygenase-like lactoylglutathione lyase family enzyme